MARNGSGTYSNPYPNFVSGTTISSDQVNANNADIATALTDSIAKDGQTTPTADLPMGAFKHTGVGNAAARTQYTAAGQIQDSGLIYAAAGGTGDVITLAPAPAITAYAAGQRFIIKASADNTTAVTLNVAAVGAKAVQYQGAALVPGAIRNGAIIEVVYDGTQFQMVTPPNQITSPNQPAFLAYNSVSDTNVTGDGTTATVDLDTEVFDRGADFAADTFTAPVTGLYAFNVSVRLESLDAGHTLAQVILVTSNRSYLLAQINPGAVRDSANTLIMAGSVIADMEAADTAHVTLSTSGGTKTVGVTGTSSPQTFFSGMLVA